MGAGSLLEPQLRYGPNLQDFASPFRNRQASSLSCQGNLCPLLRRETQTQVMLFAEGLGFSVSLRGHGDAMFTGNLQSGKFSSLTIAAILEYETRVASLQLGNTRVVFSTADFVRSLLEGRSAIHDPVPLLRLLRTKPRIFATRADGAWTWLTDAPAAHLVACDDPGWLLGLAKRRNETLQSVPEECMPDRAFAFGVPVDIFDGDALVIGGKLGVWHLERAGRRDIALCYLDVVTEWRLHRSESRTPIPGYPNEFEVMFFRAERAYERLVRLSFSSALQELLALRDVADALLISVAARALRGDFAS